MPQSKFTIIIIIIMYSCGLRQDGTWTRGSWSGVIQVLKTERIDLTDGDKSLLKTGGVAGILNFKLGSPREMTGSSLHPGLWKSATVPQKARSWRFQSCADKSWWK